MAQLDDYFTRKFAPLHPLYVIGRSYKAEPTCHPSETLFDAWKDDVTHVCALAVCDLVRIANFAHRKNMGGLVWFGWCPAQSGKRASWLSKGSHGIMMSKHGAAVVWKGMQTGEIPRGHIDLVLRDWLKEGGHAKTTQACYTYPPLGSYFEHPSECDPFNFGVEQGGRPSGWEAEKPAQGTRVATDPHGQRGKYLL